MRILVVEDEPKVAAFIQKAMQAQAYVCDVAADGLQGEEMAEATRYELVILDAMLPRKSGFEVCESLRKNYPLLPILMLTALDSTEHTVHGLNVGADDYLTKPFELSELLARVRALQRRAQHIGGHAHHTLTCADLRMDLSAKTVHRGDQAIALTAREFALLEFLLMNQRRVVSRMEILERVWETNFDTGTNVIDVYINFLRKKIDKTHAEKLIHTVTGMGYVLKEPEA